MLKTSNDCGGNENKTCFLKHSTVSALWFRTAPYLQPANVPTVLGQPEGVGHVPGIPRDHFYPLEPLLFVKNGVFRGKHLLPRIRENITKCPVSPKKLKCSAG